VHDGDNPQWLNIADGNASSDGGGVHDLNAGIASKTCLIERENGRNAVHKHCGHRSCVVRGFA
jgi:hypothetical protein